MMIRRTLVSVAVLALVVGNPTVSQAAPAINVSGFGTFGYAVTDNSEREYRVGNNGKDGADDSGTIKLDSRLGVQFDTSLNPYLSGTLQLLSRQNAEGDFTPEVEWAYLKGQVSDSVTIRVGRIGAPFFMVSDFREVGYANTMVRPPEDTYIQVPLRVFNGADINGLFEFGNTIVSAQAFIGQSEREFLEKTIINLKDTYGVNVAFERGVARFRLSYVDTQASASSERTKELSAALSGAAQLAPQLGSLAAETDGKLKQASFTSVGLELDLHPMFVASEYTLRNIEKSGAPSSNAWYVTAGFRWKNFTPYATYSQLEQTSKTTVALPPVPQLAPLQQALSSVYAASDQSTVAVGVRWDLFVSSALKLQFENISREITGANFLGPDGAGSEKEDDVKLVSFTMDFTF